MNRRKTGTGYEELAAAWLEQRGYEILERNFWTRKGEIDLVARHRGYLVFVEVKYRKNQNSGAPEEAVDRRKQRRIMEAAGVYLALHGYSPDWRMRFDVAAIEGEQIRVIENAFGDGF